MMPIPVQNTQPKKHFFTFGYDHKDKDGHSLGKFYTYTEAVDCNEAREKMFAIRGNKWAFEYDSEQDFGMIKYDLIYTPFNETKIL